MKIVTYKVYNFDELSKEAKEKAIERWYEDEDFPMLGDDLTESCKALLEEKKIIHDDLNVLYSLSHLQGDGLCFIGNFKWKKYRVSIRHSSRYYYAKNTNITLENEEGEEINNRKATNQFEEIYLDICGKLEKEGYGILEYRMDFNEFQEHCETNGYTFKDNGVMDNQ